jgi:acyl-coenzyme A thioesterase PaaI-like protein
MEHVSASRYAAAEALRALNHAFVAYEADDALLDRISAFAAATLPELHSGLRRDRATLMAAHVGTMFGLSGAAPEAEGGGDGHGDGPAGSGGGDVMADRAVTGAANPTAAELDVTMSEHEVIARVTLGAAFEGAPGRAHGGIVAAVFDDVTGFVLRLASTAAYTGQLTVRYLAPVPIETPLEIRSRLEGRDGRKLRITADCRAGDTIVATADTIYVAVDPQAFGVRS